MGNLVRLDQSSQNQAAWFSILVRPSRLDENDDGIGMKGLILHVQERKSREDDQLESKGTLGKGASPLTTFVYLCVLCMGSAG